MSSVNLISQRTIDEEIILYLKSKGLIRAALLYKLEQRFCGKGSKFNISKEDFYNFIYSLMKKRIIDVIIVEPFQVEWKREKLTNLTYLGDESYFKREYIAPQLSIPHSNNSYLFDSREIKIFNHHIMKALKDILKSIPEINKKTIIFYPKNSEFISIYENSSMDFHLNDKELSHFDKKRIDLDISLEEQISDLSILKNFRENHMCFYITLIETIHKSIVDIQHNKKSIKNRVEIFNNLVKKYAYYCTLFARSDWIEINKPNAYKWETFFKSFKLPLKTLDFKVKSIKFYDQTFETMNEVEYCIFINKESNEFIEQLLRYGYQELEQYSKGDFIAIGSHLDSYILCPSIEHFFFIHKYIIYYHLFRLFNFSQDYLKTIDSDIRFRDREFRLYETFLPVLEELFEIDNNRIHDRIDFKYHTYNGDELEIIYNKFLMRHVKIIEKKMFNYFLLRYPKEKTNGS